MVLAAGASRRLGEPKALADLGGRSALARLCAALAANGGAPVLVVTGRHDAEIRAHAEAEGLDVELLHNPDWERGRTSSVARASWSFGPRTLPSSACGGPVRAATRSLASSNVRSSERCSHA